MENGTIPGVARQRTTLNSQSVLKDRICVIGQGRWGSSLVAALRLAGSDPFVLSGRAAFRNPPAGSLQSEIFWICVPDRAIAATTSKLVQHLRRASQQVSSRIILHSSGVHSVAVLQQAALAGARTGSIHPLMTFPTRSLVSTAGVPFAVEAGPGLRAPLFRLVRRLGGQPFTVPSAGKALYHAAAVMASPLLVSLVMAARSSALQAGLTPRQTDRVLRPIMEATIRNVFTRGGAHSFSGPLARGDVDTISLHLEALAAHPFQQRIYQALALYALEVLPTVQRARLRQPLTQRATPAETSGRSLSKTATRHGKAVRRRSMGE